KRPRMRPSFRSAAVSTAVRFRSAALVALALLAASGAGCRGTDTRGDATREAVAVRLPFENVTAEPAHLVLREPRILLGVPGGTGAIPSEKIGEDARLVLFRYPSRLVANRQRLTVGREGRVAEEILAK